MSMEERISKKIREQEQIDHIIKLELEKRKEKIRQQNLKKLVYKKDKKQKKSSDVIDSFMDDKTEVEKWMLVIIFILVFVSVIQYNTIQTIGREVSMLKLGHLIGQSNGAVLNQNNNDAHPATIIPMTPDVNRTV